MKFLRHSWRFARKHIQGSLPIRLLRKLISPKLGNLNQYPPIFMQPTSFPACDKRSGIKPKISIVTPSFNHGKFIEKTILSVLNQGYENLEYIVQDGGSEDETKSILDKYNQALASWESASDNGQSHAINKGFARATGEILGWINSDDLLLPGVLSGISDFFLSHPEVDVVYGNRLLIDENGMQIGRWILPDHDSDVLTWVDYIPQETLFWRRRIWEKVGANIDESFVFAMDWDLLIRFREAGAKFSHIPYFIGAFRVHPQQKTSSVINEVGFNEMSRIRERVLGRIPSKVEIRNNLIYFLVRHKLADLTYSVNKKFQKLFRNL